MKSWGCVDASCSIEGIPVIIRFKTEVFQLHSLAFTSIEGIPVIIRFKTIFCIQKIKNISFLVLKVFQL